MLEALAAAVAEREAARAWTIEHSQNAHLQELLHRVYWVMHCAFMKAPHPDPEWEAWRPASVREAAKKAADKPLTGRQFLQRLMGR